jgi:hypothetical protein
MRKLLLTLGMMLSMSVVGIAYAAAPVASLTFKDATGTVGPNDSIDIWVTLSLDATSDPLTFSNSPFTFVPADFLPTDGALNSNGDPAVFASYTHVQTNTSFWCSGTFTNVCDPSAYKFDFHTDNSDPAKPSFNWLATFDIQPGETRNYLFGTFIPNGGPVAAGTYTFYGAEFNLEFQGLDANGADMSASVSLANTCSSQDPSCAFTRTVVAVPEPETWAMLLAGLGLVGFAARKRRVA